MNLKKTIAIGLSVAALFASFGCGGGGKQGSSSSSASVSTQQKKPLDEATIKNLTKKLTSSNMEEKKSVWPNNLPGNSFLKTTLRDNNSAVFDYNTPLKIDNLSISEIKQDGDFASTRVTYIGMDNRKINELWCFRRLDGKWKFDTMGIKTTKALQVSGYDETRLEVASNIGYTYDNSPVLVLDVRSKTATNYDLGGWNQPSYVLITDKGEFPTQNAGVFSISSGEFPITSAQSIRLYLPFKGATGTPKALRITGFNELDGLGFPVNRNLEQVVTFTFSE